MSAGWREDWRQFMRLNRGASRRLLAGVTASPEVDPAPFVIWVTALAMTPLVLTALRSTLRLSMTGTADADTIFGFVVVFRAFYIFYAMLVALLGTAAIWDALLPDRADQEVTGVLPVRPWVLAASRLTAAAGVMVLLVAAIALPVALSFGVASGLQRGAGPLPRVVTAHVLTIGAAIFFVFFSLVTVRGAVILFGSQRMTERLASLLQAAALLVAVEAFIFLPAVIGTIVRTSNGAPAPWWCAPVFWFLALYGWIAEGGRIGDGVTRALAATTLPAATALGLTLVPARWLARRAQHQAPARDRAAMLTRITRAWLAIQRPATSVAGLAVFGAATLARSRRHALLLASYTGMGVAMATIELLTAGFEDRFNLSAPRQDVLAVPLVAIFFIVFGLRAALAQPADAAANWPFRIAPPTVGDSQRAARLLVMGLGVAPVLIATAIGAFALWAPSIALQIIVLDGAAALLLIEVAFARWDKVPCGSVHAPATETVRSRWPLLILCLYLFAFRGADLQMLALQARYGVLSASALIAGIILLLRYRSRTKGAAPAPVLDPSSDDRLLTLSLSGTDG